MKILYVTLNDPSRSYGVHNKEKSYCAAMTEASEEHGHAFLGVNIVVPQHHEAKLDVVESSLSVRCLKFPMRKFIFKFVLVRRVVKFFLLREGMYRAIVENDPDVVIFRYGPTSSMAIPNKIRKNMRYITEHQAKEDVEMVYTFPGKCNRLLRQIEKWMFKKLYVKLDAIVGVTTEIAQYEIERGGGRKPFFVFTNGVCVEDIPRRKFQEKSSERINLIFVQSVMSTWSGFDRLLFGVANYRGGEKVRLKVVGSTGKYYEDMVIKLGIEDRVVFYGPKFGVELDTLFNDAHIAVGTLGEHRNQLKQATPLKVREYFARGIPVIISYDDEDIKDNFSYVLRFPADESPIDVCRIVDFVKRLYVNESGVENMTNEIREYAKQHMDYKPKCEKFIRFIEQTVKS